MEFQQQHARFGYLRQEHAAWRLLRSDNAPLILAFAADLFAEASEVPFSQAKTLLDATLKTLREDGILNSAVDAGAYLREWTKAGWLREIDNHLSKTDACELALRFAQNLEHRDSHASASHLRIVQDAVRDLLIAISPDKTARLRLLQAQHDQLQQQIDDLNAGVIGELTDREQRERIRNVYQLAAALTGDFRRVEDDIRQLDQKLRIQMIEADTDRGTVLQHLLDQEQLLADSDAGRAFEGFFQLLANEDRTREFREQLRAVLEHPDTSKHLQPHEAGFLGQLVRELSRESQRVFDVRRRSEENLRSFIDSGGATERRAIARLIDKLQRHALKFKQQGINLNTATQLILPSGKPDINSPQSLRLRAAREKFDTKNLQVTPNHTEVSNTMLTHLQTVKTREVAEKIQTLVQTHGPMSIAELIQQHYPIQAGLEELVACLRICQALGAARLEDMESVMITDRQGTNLRARIPCYRLEESLFKKGLEGLVV